MKLKLKTLHMCKLSWVSHIHPIGVGLPDDYFSYRTTDVQWLIACEKINCCLKWWLHVCCVRKGGKFVGGHIVKIFVLDFANILRIVFQHFSSTYILYVWKSLFLGCIWRASKNQIKISKNWKYEKRKQAAYPWWSKIFNVSILWFTSTYQLGKQCVECRMEYTEWANWESKSYFVKVGRLVCGLWRGKGNIPHRLIKTRLK